MDKKESPEIRGQIIKENSLHAKGLKNNIESDKTATTTTITLT